MRSKAIIGIAIAGAILLAGVAVWAAFGRGGTSGYTATAASSSNNPATISPTTNTTAVKVANTQFGNMLVDADGNTLYGFTDDKNGTSSCVGTCAQNWPPLTVNGFAVGAGLDQTAFHTITRADGETQLAVADWPLYTFAGDSQPGDVNGQGSVGKWFVVAPDGTLIKNSDSVSTPSSSAHRSSGNGY